MLQYCIDWMSDGSAICWLDSGCEQGRVQRAGLVCWWLLYRRLGCIHLGSTHGHQVETEEKILIKIRLTDVEKYLRIGNISLSYNKLVSPLMRRQELLKISVLSRCEEKRASDATSTICLFFTGCRPGVNAIELWNEAAKSEIASSRCVGQISHILPSSCQRVQ